MLRSKLAIAIAAVALSVATAVADVRVTFVNPDRYRDRDFRSTRMREAVLQEFKSYFEKLGDRYLKPGQVLQLEILDIDLAGDYEPWRPDLYDVRILRDITPPRFKLRYALEQNGRTLSEAEEPITDMNYLMNPSARFSSDRFVYEKSMLRDWFRKRFAR